MCWIYPTDTEYSRQNIRMYSRNNYNSTIEKLINRYCIKEYIMSHINFYRQIYIDKLYLSITYLPDYTMYIFVDCYEYCVKIYHVTVKSGWICPECRKPNTFDSWYAMLQYEDDISFLPCKVPPVFRKIPCQYCEKPLNRRFLKLNHKEKQHE